MEAYKDHVMSNIEQCNLPLTSLIETSIGILEQALSETEKNNQ